MTKREFKRLWRRLTADHSQADIARHCEVDRSAVTHWLTLGRVSRDQVLKVEQLTGVPRHEIRPDIYPR